MKHWSPTSSLFAVAPCRRALGLLLCFVSVIAMTDIAFAQTKNLGQTRYGIGLGRLLTSERERTRIDDLRFNVAEQTKAAKEEVDEGPKLLRIDGITQRPDRPVGQRTSVWINGKVYGESELPYGLSIVRNAKGDVTGLNSVVSKGKTEFAKIGDEITRPQTPAELQAMELSTAQPKKPTDQP